MKQTLSILFGLLCVLLFLPVVMGVSLSTLPGQSVLENSTSFTDLSLSSFATDATSFAVVSEDTAKVDCQISGTSVQFKPAAGFVGSSTCGITASNSTNTTDPQTLTITVVAINRHLATSSDGPKEYFVNFSDQAQFTFTINNAGNVNLSNIQVSVTDPVNGAQSISSSKYTLGTSTISSLNVGESTTVKLTFSNLAADLVKGDYKGELVLNVDGSEFKQGYVLRATSKSRLRITAIDVYVERDNTFVNPESATTVIVGDAYPGDEIEIKVTIENIFTIAEGMDIDDIVIETTIQNVDDGSDIDEKSGRIDLDEQEEDEEVFFFDIPLVADRGTYEVEVKAEGEDDNGRKHLAEAFFHLRVDKRRDDIKIVRATVDDLKVSCGDETTLNVLVQNFGRNKQKQARVKAVNSELDLSFASNTFELSNDIDDPDSSRTIRIPLKVPDNAKKGNHTIEVKAYYDISDLTDLVEVSLVVDSCDAKSATQSTKKEPSDSSTTAGTTTQGTTAQQAEPKKERETQAPAKDAQESDAETVAPKERSTIFIVAAALVGMVVLISIIGFIIYKLITNDGE